MDSSQNKKEKHKRRSTATPTATIIHHHTTTPSSSLVHHRTVAPTAAAVHNHHSFTPTISTRPSTKVNEPIPIDVNASFDFFGEDPMPPPPVNASFELATEDPVPSPPPMNGTMSFVASSGVSSATSASTSSTFLFALPLVVLGAYIAQTKVRRHGYTPIRMTKFSYSDNV